MANTALKRNNAPLIYKLMTPLALLVINADKTSMVLFCNANLGFVAFNRQSASLFPNPEQFGQ